MVQSQDDNIVLAFPTSLRHLTVNLMLCPPHAAYWSMMTAAIRRHGNLQHLKILVPIVGHPITGSTALLDNIVRMVQAACHPNLDRLVLQLPPDVVCGPGGANGMFKLMGAVRSYPRPPGDQEKPQTRLSMGRRVFTTAVPPHTRGRRWSPTNHRWRRPTPHRGGNVDVRAGALCGPAGGRAKPSVRSDRGPLCVDPPHK